MFQLLRRVPHFTKCDDNVTSTAITPRADNPCQRPTRMQKVNGMTMLIRERYGGEYISNDGPLLASGVPATNRHLAFSPMPIC